MSSELGNVCYCVRCVAQRQNEAPGLAEEIARIRRQRDAELLQKELVMGPASGRTEVSKTSELGPIPSGPATTSPVALKYDREKTRVELLPLAALEEIGKVLTFGARKYAPNNWRKGFAWSRLLGGLMRHVFAWARGERKDPETGLSHLAHAGCMLLFLLEHETVRLGEDDLWGSPDNVSANKQYQAASK